MEHFVGPKIRLFDDVNNFFKHRVEQFGGKFAAAA
jgi:hypothetical protein